MTVAARRRLRPFCVRRPMEISSLIKSVLKENYTDVSFRYISVEVFEDQEEHCCKVTVDLNEGVRIFATGVGSIDTIFAAFKSHYEGEYLSLRTIELDDFTVRLVGSKRSGHILGGQTQCEVSLTLKNSWGHRLSFTNVSHSLASSAAWAVAKGVEHFVNSEKAYVSVYNALQDARQRNRQDLVDFFTSQITELVRVTSYTELIAALAEDLK